jgi:hypothetical protein
MESSRLALTASVLLVSLAAPLGSRDLLPVGSRALHLQQEVKRLRAHFDSVDVELRQRGVLRLTPAQRTARSTLVEWLREYRDAGRFPVNDRFPHQAVPIFRDGQGTLCAMAYLIERSGRGDLVDRVAATRNNGYIPQLAEDRDLRAWLDSVGLTVTEAARIQPAYDFPDEPDDARVTAGYAITSIVVSGASLTTVGLNLFSPSKSTGWAGIIAGSTAIIAGAVNLDEGGDTDKVAATNMVAGGGALALGIYRLLHAPAGATASNAPVAIAPTVVSTSGAPRLGLVVHARF